MRLVKAQRPRLNVPDLAWTLDLGEFSVGARHAGRFRGCYRQFHFNFAQVSEEVVVSKKVVETIYGKHNKYEVFQETSLLGSPKYYVRCSDGTTTSGTFSSLAKAVEWAREKAEKR